MRRALLLVASSWLLVAAGEPGILSPSAFRDHFAAAVVAMTGRAATPIDEYTFSAKNTDGTDLTINTDNAYAAYRADPTQLDAILTRYTHALVDVGDEGHETIDRLVIIVRPADYIARSLPPGSSKGSFIPPKPMAGDLSYYLAVDSPDSIRTASRDDLKRWKVDEATAWRRAVANLNARVGAITVERLGGDDGPKGIGAESGLAPSILADPAYCGVDSPAGANGEIILLYSKDFFLFAIPADTAMTQRFWAAVKTETAAGRSLSSTPLACRDGHWVVASNP